MNSRAQIIATIGPSSEGPEILKSLIESWVDVVRLNFAWLDITRGERQINLVRATAAACGRTIPVIADVPGPRIQLEKGHTYDPSLPFSLTPRDEEILRWCATKQVEYVALSFVATSNDIVHCREIIRTYGGSQKIIAKIERKEAVEHIDSIIAAADAVMIARGDLGNEVALEEIPFVQKTIIAKANKAQKPVITATQMLLSMTEHQEPTRAEVTDVEEAITEGSDAVMLSEETASGRFPVEAVAMMERILTETQKHADARPIHAL